MKRGKRGLCLLMLLALAAGGCGAQETVGEEGEQIALLEPVDDASGWERAAYRNLYDAKVYSAYVCPYTEEYSFDKDVVLGGFRSYWGQSVKKGEILAYADDSALEESIRKKEEQLRDMEKEFLEYKEDTEKSLSEPEAEEARLLWILEAYREAEPEKYLPAGKPGTPQILQGNGTYNESQAASAEPEEPNGPNGESRTVSAEPQEPNGPNGESQASTAEPEEPVMNPEYLQWQEELTRFEGEYRILAHQNDTIRLQLEQRTQLYGLDREYALKELERMKANLGRGMLSSSMAGSVVALGGGGNGSFVSEKDKVVAVGDPERKLLRCEYINKASIAKAKEVYALVDGMRREVAYQPMDPEEYSRLSSLDGTVYSTFELREAEEDISVGDFGVIVLVNDSREKVLSVPESALHTDASGTFVYRKQGEESVAVTVETGMGDGVYREILSGLEEGALVLAAESETAGEERAIVERGSFHSEFTGSGFLAYPSGSAVCNPVTYGTVYFTEYMVSLYDHVEKGDAIARVRVQPDQVALMRNRTRLRQLQDRLAVLEQRDAEGNARAIAGIREEIAQVQEQIGDMEADSILAQIRADKAGIVVELTDRQPEEILEKEGELARIADEDTCYLVVENKNQLLQYGNEVTVSYTDREGRPGSTPGMVASLSQVGAGSGLGSEYSMILLPSEAIGDIPAAVQDRNGRAVRNLCTVEGVIRQMDHVLVVPRKAVWEKGGNTYVFVVREDGSVAAESFLAGGYDDACYWVVDGLEEGTEICLR